MFGLRKKKKPGPETVDTFVEATGGGWGESPNTIAGDGGTQVDFVEQTLQSARQFAITHNIPVGKEFEYTIADIPAGISGPHEITIGLLMQAERYGLMPGAILNETAYFTRIT